MRAARSHRWIAWLLPLFVLRAFLPVGFMWAPSENGMQLVLCSGLASVSTAPQHAPAAEGAHAHHDADAHASHHGDGEAPAHQMSMCPFAVTGVGFIDGAALPALASYVVITLAEVSHLAPVLDRTPVSRHRIRGPPSFV